MEKKYIESERGKVVYWIYKNSNPDAKCIIFTHGVTANHTMFEKQEEYFSKDYTVINWDVPLHGESRPYKDFTYTNAVAEMNEILKAESIEKVILAGQSMGGFVCQAFAMEYDEKVLAFIAIDTSPFGLCYYSKSDEFWTKKAGAMVNWFTYKNLIKSMSKNASETKHGYDNMMAMLSASTKKEISHQMTMIYNDFFTYIEPVKFDFPVLLILGEHDKTGKVTTYTHEWHKRDGYPLVIIKNAAHNSNVDNYEEFNRVTDEFLKSNISTYQKQLN